MLKNLPSASPKPDSSLPGSIQPKYVRCGNPTCHCAQGTLHGPYWRRYYWEDGQRKRAHVRGDVLAETRTAVERWRREQSALRAERRRVRALHALLRGYDDLTAGKGTGSEEQV